MWMRHVRIVQSPPSPLLLPSHIHSLIAADVTVVFIHINNALLQCDAFRVSVCVCVCVANATH